MSLHAWLWVLVGSSCALYLGIALRARARSTADFYLAERGVGPIANGMATAAIWMSAASFVSLAGLLALNGYDASVYLMGWTGGYVLLALLVAPYLRRFGSDTIPEFIGDRYFSHLARLVAVLCLVAVSVTLLIGQMRGVGLAFSRFLDLDLAVGVGVGMGIALLCALLGGMKGITYTQIAQYLVLTVAYLTPAVFLSLQLTDHPIPQIGLGGQYLGGGEAGGIALLDKLDQVVTDLGFGAYTVQQDTTLNLFLIALSLMIGTAALPHVIARFFSVRAVAQARSSAAWTLLFIAILFTTVPAVGAMVRFQLVAAFLGDAHVGPGETPTEQVALAELPDWMAPWSRTGLLAWEDKNGDARLQYYNEANPAFASRAADAGWRGNELTRFDHEILTLATPEIAHLPDWVIALVVAGGLAAVLATAAALLLTLASAISHDLLKCLLWPGVSDGVELLVGRIAMVPVAALAAYLALEPPGASVELVALACGLAAATLFPTLILGIFDRRANSAGAILGMLSGLLFTLAYIVWFKGWPLVPGTAMAANTPANWPFGVSPEACGALGALINFAVAHLVSRATAAPPGPIQQFVDDLRVPNCVGGAPVR